MTVGLPSRIAAPPVSFAMRPSLLLAALAALGGALPVAAQPASAPAPVRLHYARSGPAQACPDSERFGRDVTAELGVSPFEPAAGQRLSVTLGPAAGALGARLALEDSKGHVLGERTLRAPDCVALHSAAVFAAVLVLDPLGTRKASPAPEPAPSAPPLIWETYPTPPAAPEPVEPWRVSLHAFGGGSLGVLSAPAGGGGLGVRAGKSFLSAEADLSARASAAARSERGTYATSLLTAGLWPCAQWRALSACVGAELGLLRLSGDGLAAAASQALWSAAGARVGAQVPLTGALSLEARLTASCALSRSQIRVGEAVAWQMPLCGGELSAGLAWRL